MKKAIALTLLAPTLAVAATYETPGTLPLSTAAPSALVDGIRARIEDPVPNDGMMNSYTVVTDIEAYSVVSTHDLCKVAREINAITEISKLKGTAAFSDSAVEAAKSLGRGAVSIVQDPGAALSGAAKGVGKMFRRLGDRVTQGDESSEAEDSSLEQVIGFSKVKREYAYEFGVDVYSNNETLQEYLDNLSWAGYSGGVAFNVAATVATGGLAGAAITATNYTVALEEMIRDSTPSDLRNKTRERLREEGFGEDLINLFIRNAHLSPRHQAFIAGALAVMGDVEGRQHLLRRASNATSFDEGFDRQVQTQMYARVHAERPIRTFVSLGDDQVVAQAKDGSINAAAATDYVIWTEDLDGLMQALDRKLGSAGLTGDRYLWLLGGVSENAREGLGEAGWTVKADLIDDYLGAQCNPNVADVTLDE